MLVLTRREGEEIVIGDPARPMGRIRVASVKGEMVRIACDFPTDVLINRREVADEALRVGRVAKPLEFANTR